MLRIIDLILDMFQLGNVELRVIGQVAVHLSVDRRDHAHPPAHFHSSSTVSMSPLSLTFAYLASVLCLSIPPSSVDLYDTSPSMI